MDKIRQRFVFSFFILPALLTPDSAASQISQGAVILALRVQQGIALDSALAQDIDSSLTVARTVEDSLEWIHPYPDFDPYDLLVETGASWASAWREGELWTGVHFIDSLGQYYNLIRVDTMLLDNWFVLHFARPLHSERLAALYRSYPDVYAEQDGIFGDGDRIGFFKKGGVNHFVFSHGWDNCLTGCMFRFYWYVTVTTTGAGRVGQLEDSKPKSLAYIYRWNIPSYYAMTMFPNVDSILGAVHNAPEWWVRRHAIEGIWRFFIAGGPWINADMNPRWDSLKSQLITRRNDVLATLQLARFDTDPDVRASADAAINKINPTSVTIPEVPGSLQLYPNYPNPFNSATRIEYAIPQTSHVSLKVFDVLGREVTTLVDEVQWAGSKAVSFDASTLSSGVYFYALKAGDYRGTKRMVLMK